MHFWVEMMKWVFAANWKWFTVEMICFGTDCYLWAKEKLIFKFQSKECEVCLWAQFQRNVISRNRAIFNSVICWILEMSFMRKSLASLSMHSFWFAHLAQVCASCVYELVHTNNYPVDKKIMTNHKSNYKLWAWPSSSRNYSYFGSLASCGIGKSNLAFTQNAGIPEKCINFPPFPYHFRSAHNQYFMLVKCYVYVAHPNS